MSFQATFQSSKHVSSVCRQCLNRLRHENLRSLSQSSIPQWQNGVLDKPIRNVSGQKHEDNAQSLPRWAATPSAMKAPYKLRPRNDNEDFPVNENPERLDEMYKKFFGPGGETWLDEGLKWLAVTHKSFDQGRRGFNERLAWLGKRMVYLQTSLALLNSQLSPSESAARKRPDGYGRRPFQDSALRGIEDVSHTSKESILMDSRLSQIGRSNYGLGDVVRWKPRQIRDLAASGIDVVVADTMYAIVGAVALSKGGEAANDIIRKKILTPLLGVSPSPQSR